MSKKIKIIPRAKQVLVLPDPEESRELASGLLRPDNEEQERKAIGTVLAVGPGIDDIKVGSRVLYGAFAGEGVKLKESNKDIDYKLLHDDDILAFIKD